MIDQAGIRMAQGCTFACERISGVNDNMIKSHYHNYYELYKKRDNICMVLILFFYYHKSTKTGLSKITIKEATV